jgi:hypothetical protein
MSELPPPPPAPARSFPVGRLLAGAFLVVLGIGWLLETLDVVHLDWDAILPVALILVGLTLGYSAWRGQARGGLIALGIVLTGILTIGTVVDIPFGGGVGDRTERPSSTAAVPGRYELAMGKLTIDLTRLPTQGTEQITVKARVGLGQLVVLVPESVSPPVHAKVGMGDVQVFDQEEGGIAVDLDVAGEQGASYRLELSVGMGQVQVQRG